jgi:hypothetical protein
MKKVVVPLVILVSLSFSQMAFSQSKKSSQVSGETSPMQVGSVFVNAGIGVGANYYGSYDYGTAFGFKVAAEFGLWQAGPGVITLGPEIGGTFSTGAYGGFYNGNGTNNTFVIAGRGAWHFGWNVPGLDTYAGASAGIGFNHYTYYSNNNYSNNRVIPAFGGFVGASYFIKPNFGFNAEAGYDITIFQVGVVFKIQ